MEIDLKDHPFEPPHLWAIVASVSDYQGEQIDLQFSAKDAEDMAKALQLGAKRLFGVESENQKGKLLKGLRV